MPMFTFVSSSRNKFCPSKFRGKSVIYILCFYIYRPFTFIVLFLVRKLVEQTTMEHENTKEARRKLQEYNQKLGKVLMESLRRVAHNL